MSSICNEGLRAVHLHRLPNCQRSGFYLRVDQFLHIVNHIEEKSPGECVGFRKNDVILKINCQIIERMSHSKFTKIMTTNRDIILLVQNFDDYIRTDKEVLRRRLNTELTFDINTKLNSIYDNQCGNISSKALNKLLKL